MFWIDIILMIQLLTINSVLSAAQLFLIANLAKIQPNVLSVIMSLFWMKIIVFQVVNLVNKKKNF